MIHSRDERIAALEAIQEKLIEWVQHDCPFSRDEILASITKELELGEIPENVNKAP